MTNEATEIRVGFIPLIDCAPIVVAHERGFAESEGLKLILSRETSWATVRDKLAVSQFDAAHILAPMPVAANLGLGPLPTPMLVPMALGTGANSVTVSRTLWSELQPYLKDNDFNALNAANALAEIVRRRCKDSQRKLCLGIVHPYSAHHYELAYWLASREVMPGRDVDLVVVPPSLMPAAIASGHIDGFCAGEPWGTVAMNNGSGVILTTNANIWRNSPEKVLGIRSDWAGQNPECLEAMVRAVYRAALWCDDPKNHDALAGILAQNCYVGQEANQIRPSLAGNLRTVAGSLHRIEGFLSFASNAATFPWTSQALWFFSQMVRWEQADYSATAVTTARDTYRPDIYRAALKSLGVDIPSVNSKVEGALKEQMPVGSMNGQLQLGPDAFFDGKVFDPEKLSDYISSFSVGGV